MTRATKKCNQCLQEKPLDSFKKIWGYSNTCLECRILAGTSGKQKHPQEPSSSGDIFNAEEVADGVDTAAKATRVAAAVAVAGAAVAAPTGLSAVGVALGVLSAPAIVTAAPILISIAGVTAALSAAASLYAKASSAKRGKRNAV